MIMRQIGKLVMLVAFVVALVFDSVSSRRIIRATPKARKTGNLLVRLSSSLTHEEFMELEGKIMENSDDSPVYEAENDMIRVVTVKISDKNKMDKVKHLKGVEYLEEETFAYAAKKTKSKAKTDNDFPYHLDRLDEDCSSQTLDGFYQPAGDGEGVDIYILDTGIHYTHSEFEGRAKYSGKDPIDDFSRSKQQGLDCDGHGTHCASLAAGKTTGAAKKANVYSVRILDCSGSAPWSTIIYGLNHVVDHVALTKRPSIISMSLGGYFSKTFDDLVTSVVQKGIPVVVAAGNEADDACHYSPASNPHVITVGASKEGRKIYQYSNGGECVDIIAPGEDILGADRSCDTCKQYLTGTSMATPLVAGIAAIHLQRSPNLTPAEVKQILQNDACNDVLNFKKLKRNLRDSTINKLLHISAVADSCHNISAGKSGYYSVKLNNGTVKKVFCELENKELKGMAKIVDIDMREEDSTCPDGLRTIEVEGRTLCGRKVNQGCSSVFFNSFGLQYSRVCGRIRGYQYSSPNAFLEFKLNPDFTINDVYVDGIVLTYSKNKTRQHIWTFVAAIDEVRSRNKRPMSCECTNTNDNAKVPIPAFVKNNYFCETGARTAFQYNKYYLDDPLWDSEGCGLSSTCCDRGDLFCTELSEPTMSDIELRVCGNEALSNEDTPLDKIELYVQ